MIFFVSFSFACFLLNDAIDLSPLYGSFMDRSKTSVIAYLFDLKSLIVANICFQILSVWCIVDCLLAKSLSYFFHTSIIYKVLTYVDLTKNLIYAGSLLRYSLSLRSMILAMIKDIPPSTQNEDSFLVLMKLQSSLRRLVLVMALCLASFLTRAFVLLVKSFVVEGSDSDPFYWMPAYGRKNLLLLF